ncbi:MAG TPA: hypothetical protein VGO40_10920 [Longimicrobium sp.]|jgi:hypothetical protein|nr:hypothetical protein [Longimicrobium sp.]
MIRRSLCALALSACTAPLAAQADSAAPSLSRFVRADGTVVTTHAVGDPFLVAGFELANRYWSGIAARGRRQLLGSLDAFLPAGLVDDEGARRMMRGFAETFFAARDPRTGLIPYSYDVPNALAGGRTGGRQPVDLLYMAMELQRWFPDDARLLAAARALGDATLAAFDEPGAGVWGWADVKGEAPALPGVHPVQLGRVAEAMVRLSAATGDPRYRRWAEGKLRWARSTRGESALVCGTFTPRARVAADGALCDTDLLYLTRRVFAVSRLTGDRGLRAWALADTEAWFTGGWLPEHGHFARRLRRDGSPATDALYGDAKYNTLRVLVAAYRETGDARYLERLKAAWRGLVAAGSGGLAPDRVQAGGMETARGVDPAQTNFLQILVDAYGVSGDSELLAMARALGAAILRRGEAVVRMQGGQGGDAFLRLAIAAREVRRVEVALDGPAARVTVSEGGRTVVDARGPHAAAVIYLVRGGATLRTLGGARVLSDRRLVVAGPSDD